MNKNNLFITQTGFILPLTLLFLLLLMIGGSIFFSISQVGIKDSISYERRIEAFSVAESAAERALWKLGQEDWSKMDIFAWNRQFGGDEGYIRIGPGQYTSVTYPEIIFRSDDHAKLRFVATGVVSDKTIPELTTVPYTVKKIEVIVEVEREPTTRIRMPRVFDYVYFINNWGWWYYGGGEKCYGSMRSNGRFDIHNIWILYGYDIGGWTKDKAVMIDGSIEGHFDVDYHDFPPDGLAGLQKQPPEYNLSPYKKPNLEKECIPNLQDMGYYKRIAQGYNPITGLKDHSPGMIRIGDRIFTDDGIFGDNEPHKNLVLIGTKDVPIEIQDTVVIEGNLVIKGYVTGRGSIYVGRNVYIAGDVRYVNPPDWDSYPGWEKSYGKEYKDPIDNTFNIKDNDDALPGSPSMDEWVRNNWEGTNTDLLAVAAKGGLVYGDYTAYDWYAEYWLFDMGSEDVGADGIPGTNIDDSDPTEGDGIPQPETEDLDGDGCVRMHNYNWKDITITGGNSKYTNPLADFDGLRYQGRFWDPITKKRFTHYSHVATNNIRHIDGVYYTQHFIAGRCASSPIFRGSIISKDEAIVYSGTLRLIQDTRYHSKYRKDPNFPLHLFPPGTLPKIKIEDSDEDIKSMDEDTYRRSLGVVRKVISWKEI